MRLFGRNMVIRVFETLHAGVWAEGLKEPIETPSRQASSFMAAILGNTSTSIKTPFHVKLWQKREESSYSGPSNYLGGFLVEETKKDCFLLYGFTGIK